MKKKKKEVGYIFKMEISERKEKEMQDREYLVHISWKERIKEEK